MITKLRITILLILIHMVACLQLLAQEIEFVPSGVIQSTYDFQSITTSDYMAAGMEKKTILESMLHRNQMDEDDVEGSIKYQSSKQILQLKYGLFDVVNLMLVIPYIDIRRESSLKVSDSTNSEQNSFVENWENAESNGLGDIALWGIWRLVYNDESEVHFGFGVDGDNAPYYYNEKDKIALGSGAQELSAYVNWLAYPRGVEMTVKTEAGVTYTKNSSVTTENGEELTLKRQNNLYLQILLSFNQDRLNWGGAICMNNFGETDIDGVRQGDGYLSYTTKLFLNLGNMHLLEEDSVSLPWSVGIYAERVVFGANAPNDQIAGLKVFVYF